MKKVVFFIGGFSWSGAERRIHKTAIELSADKSVEIIIFISTPLMKTMPSGFDGAHRSNVQYVSYFMPGVSKYTRALSILFSFFPRLSTIFKRPDVAHMTCYSPVDFIVGAVFRLFGVKIIYEVTSPDAACNRRTKILLRNRWLWDRIIAVSPSVYELCALEAQNTDAIFCRKSPYVDEVDHKKFNLNEKRKNAVFAHRLIHRKNPILALKVFKRLAVKFPDWNFSIYGRGPLSNNIDSEVSGYGLRNLSYKGYTSKLGDILTEASLFFSLIEPDNYPSQSVLEAMSLGCIPILSNTGSTEAMFYSREFDNAVIVPLCEDKVFEAVSNLIGSNKIRFFQERAYSFFKERFSREAYLHESKKLIMSWE